METMEIKQDWSNLDKYLAKLGVADPTPMKQPNAAPVMPHDEPDMEVASEEEIQPEEPKHLEEAAINLTPNRVYLGTALCGLYIDCEEIKIGDMYIVLVLKEESGSHFALHPGSRFYFYYLDLTNTKIEIKIYFSGIIFKHDTKLFLVFHLV